MRAMRIGAGLLRARARRARDCEQQQSSGCTDGCSWPSHGPPYEFGQSHDTFAREKMRTLKTVA